MRSHIKVKYGSCPGDLVFDKLNFTTFLFFKMSIPGIYRFNLINADSFIHEKMLNVEAELTERFKIKVIMQIDLFTLFNIYFATTSF